MYKLVFLYPQGVCPPCGYGHPYIGFTDIPKDSEYFTDVKVPFLIIDWQSFWIKDGIAKNFLTYLQC